LPSKHLEDFGHVSHLGGYFLEFSVRVEIEAKGRVAFCCVEVLLIGSLSRTSTDPIQNRTVNFGPH
jgi:hypothetical protein